MGPIKLKLSFFNVNYGYANANAAFHIFSFFNDTHLHQFYFKVNFNPFKLNMLIIVFGFLYLHEFGWYLRDHPFKTSANFHQFLTPTPLPSAVF